MKLYLKSLSLLLMLSQFVNAAPLTSISQVKQTIKNIDGQRLTLQELKQSQGLLIIFIGHHCPYVDVWWSRLVQIGKMALKQKVGVVMINSNNPKNFSENSFANMVNFHQKKQIPFPYGYDENGLLAKKLQAQRTPEVFFFDAENRLIYHGAIDDNPDEPEKVQNHYLKQILQDLAAGKPLKKQATPTLGCRIQ